MKMNPMGHIRPIDGNMIRGGGLLPNIGGPSFGGSANGFANIPYRDLLYGSRGDSITRTGGSGQPVSVSGGNPMPTVIPPTSMPYPVSPMATGLFNQQALGLANPQAAQMRNVQFSGPNYEILEQLRAQDAANQPEDPMANNTAGDWMFDPLGVIPDSAQRIFTDPLDIFGF